MRELTIVGAILVGVAFVIAVAWALKSFFCAGGLC